MTAWKVDPTAERVNVLDMGGGTLSFTSYSTEFGELSEAERTIADCGGVNAIVGALQLGMSSRDNAGIQLYPKFIERALRTSKTKQVLYDMGDNFQNIYEAFESAMCDWLQINPQVQHLLKFVRFALINNQKVFLTGGGFSSVVIQEFILNHLVRSGKVKGKAKRKKDDSITIDRELISPLENGHILNITGLKELPSLIPNK